MQLPLSSQVLGKSCCCNVAPREEAGAAIYYAHTKAAPLKPARPSHLECCWNECFVFPTRPGVKGPSSGTYRELYPPCRHSI